jgi:hypothetical protein
MRTLIIWLRQIFCKHEWVRETRRLTITHGGLPSVGLDDYTEHGERVYLHCTRCMYHKSFWEVR